MKTSKNILLVAYHFPPVGGLGAAGSQRMLKFAKHLPAFGWSPTVLTVKVLAYESYLKIDPSLLRDVSPDLPVVRTGVFRVLAPLLQLKNLAFRRNESQDGAEHDASTTGPAESSQTGKSAYQRFKDSITDLFEIPDEVAGWMLPAIFSGARTIRKQKIDVILATGRPWTTLVIGAALKRLTGRPLIVDFRDPWMTNPFRIQHSSLKNRLETWPEKWVLRSADLVVANTDRLREEFIERFGATLSDRCITVINGFDANEFELIEPEQRDGDTQDLFVLLHSGFLYGMRDPKTLIDAIKLLHDRGDLESVGFRCELVGSVELTYDLESYIRQSGLQDLVHLRGEVSYAESIAAVAACDTALLLQPGTKTQIPSKVFEYVGLAKRILTIAPLDSSVSKLVEENGLGLLSDPDDVVGIADAIKGEIGMWAKQGDGPAIAPDVQARFDVRNSVQSLSQEIDGIVE